MSNENRLGCEIVKDLLPNYIEGLTSPETSRQVEEHLAGCAPCNGSYHYMRAKMELETAGALAKDRAGKHFFKKVRVKRVLIVLLTLLLCVMLLAVATGVMNTRRYIGNEAIHLKNIYELSDGRIVCAFEVDGFVPGQAWIEGGSYYDWPSYHGIDDWRGDFEAAQELEFVYQYSTRLFNAKRQGDTFYWEISEAQLRKDSCYKLELYGFEDRADAPKATPENIKISVRLKNGPTVWWPEREDIKKVSGEEELQLLGELGRYYQQNHQGEVMPIEGADSGIAQLPFKTTAPRPAKVGPTPEAGSRSPDIRQ